MRDGIVEVNPEEIKTGPPRRATPSKSAGLPERSWGDEDERDRLLTEIFELKVQQEETGEC